MHPRRADGSRDRPAHPLVVGGVEIGAGQADREGFGGPVLTHRHIHEHQRVFASGFIKRQDQVHGIEAAHPLARVRMAGPVHRRLADPCRLDTARQTGIVGPGHPG